jgi:hypothetical protein
MKKIIFITWLISSSFWSFAQEMPLSQTIETLNPYLANQASNGLNQFSWNREQEEYLFISNLRNNDRDSENHCKLYLSKAQFITFGKWGEIFQDQKSLIPSDFHEKLEFYSKMIERESQLAKNYFKRPRPFRNTEKPYAPCYYGIFNQKLLSSPKYLSFPSTHSVQARLASLYLSVILYASGANDSNDIDELLKQALPILKTGALMGHYRVLAGHHYPTDVLAGEALADAYFCAAFEESLINYGIDQKKCDAFVTKAHEEVGIKAISLHEKWPFIY